MTFTDMSRVSLSVKPDTTGHLECPNVLLGSGKNEQGCKHK